MTNRAKYIGMALGIFAFAAVCLTHGAEKKNDELLQEMEIGGLGFDRANQTPVVLLTDKKREKVLPIWIGLCEARSIEIGLSGIVPPVRSRTTWWRRW